MAIAKVTVLNSFLHGVIEEFICTDVDFSDLQEVEYCADECCGEYLEMHHDAIKSNFPDLTDETIAEACSYLMEEVGIDELDL